MADFALFVLASQALSDVIVKKDVPIAPTQFPLISQPLVIPTLTTQEVAEAYVSADTDVPMMTFQQWLQQNPGGNFVRYSKYVTGFN